MTVFSKPKMMHILQIREFSDFVLASDTQMYLSTVKKKKKKKKNKKGKKK